MSVSADTVMRAWFDEVWNQGREDAIDRLFAPGGVAHGLPGGPINGPQAFRSIFTAFRGAFPDIHFDIERTVVDGELVAVHCRVSGTHTGATLGVAPTGKQVDFCGMVIARIVGGQFQEGWNCFDFLTMYQQIGVVPQF